MSPVRHEIEIWNLEFEIEIEIEIEICPTGNFNMQ